MSLTMKFTAMFTRKRSFLSLCSSIVSVSTKSRTISSLPRNISKVSSLATQQSLFGKQKHLIFSLPSTSARCLSITSWFSGKGDADLTQETPGLPSDGTYIPEPPGMPTEGLVDLPVRDLVLNHLGEPTFSSLGLGSYWPSGWVQLGLEYLHVNVDMPWWAAITLATVVIRVLMFPLIVTSRRKIIDFTNNMPTFQLLTEQMMEARASNNYFEMMKVSKELESFQAQHNINPLNVFMLPLIQMPIFLSMFFGLRGMANLPVGSMQTGGLFWFTDMTAVDPFFLLPILSMASLVVMLEVGADVVPTTSQTHTMKWVMRCLPFVTFFFVMNFPAALCYYWTVNNFISLGQAMLLKQPKIRTMLNIPADHKRPEVKKRQKKFIQGFKESMNNSRLMKEMEARERIDDERWKKAGQGPIMKTYPYDPTKVKNPPQIVAKKKKN